MPNKYEEQSRMARERYKKWRMCQRKKGFKTLAAAQQKGQRAYKCPHCGKYHRTSINAQ